MRRSLSWVVALTVFLSTSTAFAEQSDPCAGVSCSGHGTCVVIRGEPGCVCEDDYRSDNTGLYCYVVETIEENDQQPASVREQNSCPCERRILRAGGRGFWTWFAGTLLHCIGAAAAIGGTAITMDSEYYGEYGGVRFRNEIQGTTIAIIGGSVGLVGMVLSIVGGGIARRDHRRGQRGNTSSRSWTLFATPSGDGGGVFGFTGSF